MEGVIYHAEACPDCGEGWLVFWRSEDGAFILLCEECDATWDSPRSLGPKDHHRANVWEGREATREEIHALGWEQFIVGEFPIYRNKFGQPISAEKAESERLKRMKRQTD